MRRQLALVATGFFVLYSPVVGAQSYSTLFSDSFQGTLTNWEMVAGTSAYVQTGVLNVDNGARIGAAINGWADYLVKTSITVPDATNAYAAVYLRASRGTPAAYVFMFSASGHWTLSVISTVGFASSIALGDVLINPGASHFFQFKAMDRILQISISGDGTHYETVTTIMDSAFSFGTIALEGNGKGGGPVAFGPILVQDLAMPVAPCPTESSCGGGTSGGGGINQGCHGDCVCYAGPNPATGTNGYACGWLGVPVPDNETNHFRPVNLSVDVSGIVNAGGCDSRNMECALGDCSSPALAGGDDILVHRDRDFNFSIIPMFGGAPNRSLLTVSNLFGSHDEGMGDLEVEWEWMYMFPTWGALWYHNSTYRFDVRGSVPALADGMPLGFPLRGDQVTVRGRHILDCGHVGGNGQARAELHPPVAVLWSHPVDGERFNSTVWLRATSHFAQPASPHDTFGGPLRTSFKFNGGGNGQPIYAGPLVAIPIT